MNRRRLGNTGERVSELGLDTTFMRRSQDQNGVNDCLARAIEHGVSYFDTAADYGQGEDERTLGEGLKGRRDSIFLATKVGGVKDEGGHRNVDSLMRQHEEGLKRLQTDHVDLIQLHENDQRKWWCDDPVLPLSWFPGSAWEPNPHDSSVSSVAPISLRNLLGASLPVRVFRLPCRSSLLRRQVYSVVPVFQSTFNRYEYRLIIS